MCNDDDHNYMPIGEPRKLKVGHWAEGITRELQKIYCTKCGDIMEIAMDKRATKDQAKESE
jgi:hypothetical protein